MSERIDTMSGNMQTRIQCPSCRTPFAVEVERIIDAGSDPGAKERLLRGQVNVAVCPQCGHQAMLSGPLLYHDPAHEMLLVYVPLELNMDTTQREQLIGSLTRELMGKIPAEARKGYLFSPQLVMTFDSLMDRILQAEGVPADVLERQKKQGQLLKRLIAASESELAALVREHDDEIDQVFFHMLSAQLEAARMAGQQHVTADLLALRDRILSLASWSRDRGITPKVLDAQKARLDLMQSFLEADETDWPSLAKEHNAEIDYLFFQLLTAVAEQEDQEHADRLLHLRSRLMDLSSTGRAARASQEAVDGLSQAAKDAGGLTREVLLERLLAETDESAIETVALAGSSVLDYSFFLILADQIDAAEKQDDQDLRARLLAMREKLLELTATWDKARAARVDQIGQKLDAFLQASDKEAATRRLFADVDELFLSVLAGRVEAATKGGQDAVADTLERLLQGILAQIRAAAPPHIQLINELIDQEDDDAVRTLLAERREELTPELLQTIEGLGEDLQASGDDELAQRLSRIVELVAKFSEKDREN